MVTVLGDDNPVLSAVKKWVAEFRKWKESLEVNSRFGRPSTATIEENIVRVHHMVIDASRLTRNRIVNAIRMSRERIENIPHNALGITKVSSHYIPQKFQLASSWCWVYDSFLASIFSKASSLHACSVYGILSVLLKKNFCCLTSLLHQEIFQIHCHISGPKLNDSPVLSKNKPYLVIFRESILNSLWLFQPTFELLCV